MIKISIQPEHIPPQLKDSNLIELMQPRHFTRKCGVNEVLVVHWHRSVDCHRKRDIYDLIIHDEVAPEAASEPAHVQGRCVCGVMLRVGVLRDTPFLNSRFGGF